MLFSCAQTTEYGDNSETVTFTDALDREVYDSVECVSDEEAYEWAKKCAKLEGVFAGVSSGAALCAAVRLAKLDEYADKDIVVLIPDTGERYLSTENFID